MKNINIIMFCAVASLCCSLNAQTIFPLEASSGAYTEAAIDLFLKQNDKDENGKFEKSEDAKPWRRNQKLDKNRDGALDREELPGVLKYVDNPGKQLRIVCFKRVETRKVYLDFYFPDVDKSEKKPIVIYTHGGGWGPEVNTELETRRLTSFIAEGRILRRLRWLSACTQNWRNCDARLCD